MKTRLNRRGNLSFGDMLSPKIPDLRKAREDLRLSKSRIDAFEPSLYDTITLGVLRY